MIVIGLDIGFGFTKTTDGNAKRLFKSVMGEAKDLQYREQLSAADSETPYLHLQIGEQGLFVGDLAERQSSVRSFTLDQDQLISDFAKSLGLAALSQFARDNEPLHVVTGLPVRYYRRHQQQLAELLTGTHKVTLFDPAGNGKDLNIKVEKVRVIPQPFGSMFGLMLNNIGRVADQRIAKQKIGVIDVGFRTADYSIADKTRYSERGSGSSDAGIAQAFEIIASALQEKSGVKVELYRLYEAVQEGSIKVRGKNYDLTRITDRAFAQLANAVASEVNRLWADDWDIDLIVVTGGGGAVLAPHLSKLIQGEILPVDKTADARFNNVTGYWKYGVHLWQRQT